MADKKPLPQLELFSLPTTPTRAGKVEPAQAPAELSALGKQLPPDLYLGTSSWSFPGWQGLVYAGEHREQTLAKEGLAAYAQHPLLNSVGIDRTYYGPIAATAFAQYADSVPERFRFLVKAHELCTLKRFPDHPRYGNKRGTDNPYFLDAAYASEQVIEPMVEGLGAKAGPLVFQFAPQSALDSEDFPDRLHQFLRRLPAGPLYAVELRNPELLTAEYAEALTAANAVHCFNVWSRMPSLQAQRERVGPMKDWVDRWLLPRQLKYEEAKERYSPFNRLVDEDLASREEIAHLVAEGLGEGEGRGRRGFVIVNNKAEGSSPLSVAALAKSVAEAKKRGSP